MGGGIGTGQGMGGAGMSQVRRGRMGGFGLGRGGGCVSRIAEEIAHQRGTPCNRVMSRLGTITRK